MCKFLWPSPKSWTLQALISQKEWIWNPSLNWILTVLVLKSGKRTCRVYFAKNCGFFSKSNFDRKRVATNAYGPKSCQKVFYRHMCITGRNSASQTLPLSPLISDWSLGFNFRDGKGDRPDFTSRVVSVCGNEKNLNVTQFFFSEINHICPNFFRGRKNTM